MRSDAFTVTANTAFKAVMAGCAAPQEGRNDTWINKRIRDLYFGLHQLGHCHSVEVWQDGDLAGGLYGVSLGRAFFGESMFHHVRDASKVALVHLVARLIAGGFELLDTQYVTEHLRTFGPSRFRAAATARCSTARYQASRPIFSDCLRSRRSPAPARWRLLRRSSDLSCPGRVAVAP